jgi:RecA/RadA recombinase
MSFVKNLRKAISKKSSDTIHEGFYNDEKWISSGNIALNRMLSGSYTEAYPYGRQVCIGGVSGSGKSLLAATGLANAQQAHNAIGIWLDAENASKEAWLAGLGVDTSPERLIYCNVATVEDVKTIISTVTKDIRAEIGKSDQQPVYIVVDSYSALLTESQFKQAEEGKVVGDQGQHAKQVKDLVKAANHLVTRLPVCLVGMVHTMASQDKYNPDEVLTSGRGVEYLASIVVVMNKMKLQAKDMTDEDLKEELMSKTDDDRGDRKVVGLRSRIQVYKSRFAKPHEAVTVQIPYPYGIDMYSGLFDQMLQEMLIISSGTGWYSYTNTEGKLTKFQKSSFKDHVNELMKIGSNRAAASPVEPSVDVE